jgi:hypothetical protein
LKNVAIPEAQLETWSHQGSITQSSSTYNTIKNALQGTGAPYATKDFEVFLQGSYGNDTNIYAESDVDVVIKLNDCFGSDRDQLSDAEKTAWKQAYPNDATYGYTSFKNDVMSVLVKGFGADVKPGDKAIMVEPSGGRRKSDVIAAIRFRRYYKFNSLADQGCTEGICFYNAAGERIANYPKQHSQNLTAKHQQTNSWFKPMVRILKNLRTRLVEKNMLETSAIAPSYYLEGLLYNVPNSKFGTSFGASFVNAVNWIQNDADKTTLVCANEQYYLIRDNSHMCWPKANSELFLNAAISLWNNW